MLPNLKQYIERYIDLPEETAKVFQSLLKERQLNKKEYLTQPGHHAKSRYFILKGSLRLFYIDPKGHEQIIHFAIENWWVADYESLINRTPSKLYIQAIEPTELLELTEDDFAKICQTSPEFNTLFRIIMEKTYVAMQRRMEYMFSLSGEAIYHTFIKANPKFAQRVPQYMIASYLGMTPEFISKVRAGNK